MRIFLACLAMETNTFSPIPTGIGSFHIERADDLNDQNVHLFSGSLLYWKRSAQRDGHEVTSSLIASATPGGKVVRRAYEGLRDQILEDLAAAGPVDIVLLSLHGSMVADGYDDCEGDLLERVRRIVGPHVVLGCLLDPHCVLTASMTRHADLIIIFKEWPHLDSLARAKELYALALRTARKEVKPIMRVFDCRMLGNFPTERQPMRAFIDRLTEIERSGVALSISFAHSFIWADVPEMGAKMLVITDGREEQAASLAEQLGLEVWGLRDQIAQRFTSIDEALDRCADNEGAPVILADGADGPAGGAPGDATFVLSKLIERKLSNALTGCYWDPVAVKLSVAAGEGASLMLRVGGKLGPTSGAPVDIQCKVERIVDGAFQSTSQGGRLEMGTAVWLSACGIDLVLTSERVATFGQDAFRQLGIELRSKRVIIVKAAMHFYPSFAPIASQIFFLAGPGTSPMDPRLIVYRNFQEKYWPVVQDPFSSAVAE